MKKIRVLLADDQVLFVESLRNVLRTRARDIEVLDIAHDGREAVQIAVSTKPDVVVMDVRMPDLDGVQATREILRRLPETQIMVLSTFHDDEYVEDALKYGAAGYMLKDIGPEELIASIRALSEGAVLIAPLIANRLVGRAYPREPSDEAGDADWLKYLTDRERRVLELLAQGHDNREIAVRLNLAQQTVKNTVSSLYSKIGVHDRVQVARLASKLRLRAG